MHTCNKWRRIALASRGALRLRLLCTYGTQVQKSLHVWPTLPIVVEYGGLPTLDPPVPEDEDNIIAALKQSDRVISISLTVTSSLMEKLSTIEGAFSELQDLVLLSCDRDPLTIPNAFRGVQRLRRLHSTGIAFPSLFQLLSSTSMNLIDLQLHKVLSPWKFPPEMLMAALSKPGQSQLRSLSLHVSSSSYYHFPLPPYGKPAVLPALTCLKFQGSMAYLEGIVAIIDAPSLEDIDITSNNGFFALPIFKKFVDQIEMHRLHLGAYILSSEPTISMSLTRPGALTCLKLQVLCKPCPKQIFSKAQFCLNFSPFHFNNEGGTLISTTRLPVWADGSYDREWLGLLDKFTGKKLFRLDVNHSISVMHTLQPPRQAI